MTRSSQDPQHPCDSGAVWATRASDSRGRLVAEPPSLTRTAFQRDRDRIIHSGAFRKLRNKTQVFIESEGDYYRTRLTHSLEVAQIGRSLARALGLNEDLTETLALAHDLGHTCFGHAGEEALDQALKPWGGFSHNEQTFRILTNLERRYIGFDGLNLTWETLEGVVKHNGPLLPESAEKPVPATIAAFSAAWDLELGNFAGPEAQVAALADDIAYNSHDIDDGYRAGLFGFDDIRALAVFGPILEDTLRHHPDAEVSRVMQSVVRQVIGSMVTDVLDTTRAGILALQPKSVTEVRRAAQPVVRFSFAMEQNIRALREFLRARMYRHSTVNRACARASQVVKGLFSFMMDNPACLPNDWRDRLRDSPNDDALCARLVADYIAGMTDRFAAQEYQRLFSMETLIG